MNIKESFFSALNSIRANKLRASLTLLGIVIGVFSIIGVMTLLDALQKGIDSGLSQLGTSTFQVQKWPATFVSGPGKWRKYEKRKPITIDEGYRLKELAVLPKYIGLEDWSGGKSVKYGSEQTNPNFQMGGVTTEFLPANNHTLSEGRFFTEEEVKSTRNIAVVGMEVVDKLFPFTSPLDKEIEIDGNRFTIIGVLTAKGENLGQSQDNLVLVPLYTIDKIYGARKDRSLNITVSAYSKAQLDETQEEVIGLMRQIRKVPPGEENDFDIWSNESLVREANNFTVYFKYGAGVISFISLIAAGIGIMNIMLVTVTERTKEIGIRMAIGAKRSNILTQFLFEAILLCELGGLIGIAVGIGIGNLLGSIFNFPVTIPYDWVAIGVIVCSLIGIIFGTYPAFKAAKLNPIDALRYE
ncbi:MAG TPA: ABC transporter permease [Ignavibacteria bacterium]|nr:ABC transporter permease [Ignavibacteria bacterium]HMR00153.1 ABC transporter permease [Ignavibacteria bacterium]